MNKLICAIAFLLSFLPASGQLLRVTQNTQGFWAGSSAFSFPAPPAPGDTLLAMMRYYAGCSPTTAPTGWTLVQQQYGNGAGGTTGFISYYHVVAAGEANSYTFVSCGNATTMTIYDVTGSDLYHPINGVSATAQKTTSASVTTPSIIPSVPGTLRIAAVADEGSNATGLVSAGWNYTASVRQPYGIWTAYGPRTTDTTTPVSASFSLDRPDTYGLVGATFLINPAGTTGNTPMASVGGPYAGVNSFAINFDGSASSDPRQGTLSYAWDFGDRSTGTGVRPTHVYATPGNYTVALKVTNADGNFANASTAATIAQDCSGVALGKFGALNNFIPSPSDAWHQDISGAAVDPMSDTILLKNPGDLAGSYLHPDFGGNGQYGIPYTVVDSSITPSVPLTVTEYPDESDLAVFPIPADMPVESAPGDCAGTGDNHAIVFDKHSCVVHEMYHTQHCSTGTTKWSAGSTAMWDLTQVEKRPYGITSVDAAGLSVFEGLIRYDEIVTGKINHAIRFTAQFTKNNASNGYFTGAATHAAGILWGTDNIEGMRIRLKASFDISTLGPQAKIIATAMKKYGMILADNGANMYFQGTPDTRWDDDDLGRLKGIPASAFEVVNQSLSTNYTAGSPSLYPNGPIYDAVNHPTGASPTISSFTASSDTITSGQSVTLSSTLQDSSYTYIDQVGFVRGPVTVSPTATTTYTLTSRNAYGTTTAITTVTVLASVAPSLALTPVSNMTYGTAPFAILASSNSSSTITYSVVSGPASLAGTVLTLTGVGSVTVQASQVAAGNFTAATTQVSFTVTPAMPSLSFAAVANQVYGTAPLVVASTSNSQGSTSYSIVSGAASLSGNVVTPTGVGRIVMMASQAAAGNYAAATSTVSFMVTPQTPQLSFAVVPTQTAGGAPVAVNASSQSAGAITYSVVSGPATVSGNLVAATGAGTVVLQASQAAAGNYGPATATASFAVTLPPSVVTLVFSNTTVTNLLPVAFYVNVAANGKVNPTGSVTILDGGRVVAISALKIGGSGNFLGSLLSSLTAGQHRMTAVYSGDRNYGANTSAPVTVTVMPTPQPIKVCPACITINPR